MVETPCSLFGLSLDCNNYYSAMHAICVCMEGNDNAWWSVVLREPVVCGWGAVSYLDWTSYHRG